MSRLDQLRHVADLVGIGTRYLDALGVWHEPDEDVLSRLIAAFGLPTEPAHALDALAARSADVPFGLGTTEIVDQEAPVLALRGAGRPLEWLCRARRWRRVAIARRYSARISPTRTEQRWRHGRYRAGGRAAGRIFARGIAGWRA
jgi:hypothetical protein